jgi:hypothetical protein
MKGRIGNEAGGGSRSIKRSGGWRRPIFYRDVRRPIPSISETKSKQDDEFKCRRVAKVEETTRHARKLVRLAR